MKYFNSSTGDSIKIDYYENYYASKQYPANVTIETKIAAYPAIHSAGDTLNARCNWKSGGYMLKWDDHSIREAHYNIASGTWRSVYKKYIGIRFLEKSDYVYGWIELSVDGYNISLHRFAFQPFTQIKYSAQLTGKYRYLSKTFPFLSVATTQRRPAMISIF